jgi:Icc-related predicted phosphoesterase
VKLARTETDDLGDEALRRWVAAHQPAVVICGHVHHPRIIVGNTLVVNGGREGYVLQV